MQKKHLEFWQRLKATYAHGFCARSPLYPERRGSACVHVEELSGRSLVFIERGEWSDAQQTLSFRTQSRWTLTEGSLKLEHLRLAQPVFLIELHTQTAQRLVSRQAHQCGKDLYQAELVLSSSGLELTWRVTGPAKDEELRIQYYCA